MCFVPQQQRMKRDGEFQENQTEGSNSVAGVRPVIYRLFTEDISAIAEIICSVGPVVYGKPRCALQQGSDTLRRSTFSCGVIEKRYSNTTS